MAHLKDRQSYIDRYDHMTVEDCRWHENFHKNYPNDKAFKNDTERELVKGVGNVAWHFEQLFITLDWYDRKEATIQKWMADDERRDQQLEQARIPENIFCNECYSRMEYESKHLWDMNGTSRVLFFFSCPQGCKRRRAIYEDGEEYITKPKLCAECSIEIETKHERLKDDQIRTTYTCLQCGHEETDIFDLSSPKEEPDPKYEFDRARFCLSGDALLKAQEEKRSIEQMKALMAKIEARGEKKDVYDKVAALKKLTIPQLKAYLLEQFDQEDYTNLTFEKPDLSRIVSIEFSVEELNTDNERVSERKLKKLIQKHLEGTNWRLMSDGVSYRLGVLSGRVRVYEDEDELAKLIEK